MADPSSMSNSAPLLKRSTCSRCQRPMAWCLCAHIPHISNRTRILVLQHHDERHHALNTARLAVLGLARAELWIGETFPGLAERITQARETYLLFPGEGAIAVDTLRALPSAIDAVPSAEKGPARENAPLDATLLIVPDGTWRKARKILHTHPVLAALPRVTLAHAQPSTYRLRKAAEPNALSTIEAIAQTLGALEPETDFGPLLKPFDALIAQQITAMGAEVYARNYG